MVWLDVSVKARKTKELGYRRAFLCSFPRFTIPWAGQNLQGGKMQYGQFAMMVEKMRSEKHLLLHSPDSLLAQWQAGLSVVHCESDQIVAHVTLWPLTEEWFELGNIWVDQARRGHGCGNRVMAEVLGKREHIMLTSTNPVVWRMSEEHGLLLVQFAELPSAVWCATCICDPRKRGHNDFRQCVHRDHPCRLYVK